MSRPEVDIVLPVRNAVEILPGTLQSLCDQSNRAFRVVVVDGASTDGTLDVLDSFSGDLHLDVVSGPDRHLSDALAKGLARATADVVGILASDERYEQSAVDRAIRTFQEHPDAVACAGSVRFIEAAPDGTETAMDSFVPDPFDVIRHLSCEVIWPISATFFNRRILGSRGLRYDATRPTCPDYELWARLGLQYPADSFVRMDETISTAFRSAVSMSFRPEAFAQMAEDKLAFLGDVMASVPPGLRERLFVESASGIHVWAAEQLLALGAPTGLILGHCLAAEEIRGPHERLDRFLHRSQIAQVDAQTGQIAGPARTGPEPDARVLETATAVRSEEHWRGADVTGDGPWAVLTSDDSWGYSAEIILSPVGDADLVGSPSRYWGVLDLEVISGAVGVGVFGQGDLVGEKILRPESGRQVLNLVLDASERRAMIRSAGSGGSRVLIHSAVLASYS